jgi:hypothetical protein
MRHHAMIVDLTDPFESQLRAQTVLIQRHSELLRVANAELRQLIHDAWMAGLSIEHIAEVTGLPKAEVHQIAMAWPSMPDPVRLQPTDVA